MRGHGGSKINFVFLVDMVIEKSSALVEWDLEHLDLLCCPRLERGGKAKSLPGKALA